jgi:hypothetical protein
MTLVNFSIMRYVEQAFSLLVSVGSLKIFALQKISCAKCSSDRVLYVLEEVLFLVEDLREESLRRGNGEPRGGEDGLQNIEIASSQKTVLAVIIRPEGMCSSVANLVKPSGRLSLVRIT